MHKLATVPGGWNPDAEGVIFVEQNCAPIILITAADTDIQTLASVITHLPNNFPEFRVVNLLQLQQQLTIDVYAETVLAKAKIIILRLLGGRSYWSYGLEVIKEIVEENNISLYVLPGDDRPDPDLISHSTVSLTEVNQLWYYFIEGGIDNLANALKFASNISLETFYNCQPPQIIPKIGIYTWDREKEFVNIYPIGKVAIIFYRSHYLAGNTLPIDDICRQLTVKNLQPIPIFLSSLKDPEVETELLSYLEGKINLILNTTSFAIAKIDEEDPSKLWQKLNVPVFQVIFSSSSKSQWENSWQGLTPRDIGMNVALPEVDGRIITRAISFKSVQTWNDRLETDVVIYQSDRDRLNFLCNLATKWIELQQTPPAKRKIALILANYPNKDGRIGNGVGLDTPASCLEILKALKQAGYCLENIPKNGDELIARLTRGVTNDLELNYLRPIYQQLSLKEYQEYFITLPEKVRQGIIARWGEVEAEKKFFAIPGICLGNIFIGIQPSRGYDRDPSLNYHAPDLEPTHDYLAYYHWLKEQFGVQAIVHVGKHGNLEWLPGKSVALSKNCYPEVTLGPIPHIYPFIVNDPGEGAQAKRRASAIIIDHLTPPLTRAELYGGLQELETAIDEYYEAQSLDPSRMKTISERIFNLIETENLSRDFGLEKVDRNTLVDFLNLADGYLCELKEAQIRDGLHIFGQTPQGKQLIDLTIAIARSPSLDRLGLFNAIAKDNLIDLPIPPQENDFIAQQAFSLVSQLIENPQLKPEPPLSKNIQIELDWIQTSLLPKLQQTPQELTNLLQALDGKYIPAGASGAPTRGKPEVLPTGRNFYSVDIRAIPTPSAWDVGRKAAETLIERYTQENGEYPQTLAISIWGTSTMRTGGDDIAQVLALMGLIPVWDNSSCRVVDLEILAPSALGRPRVDVTVRVSGLFRDSFPNLLELLYRATEKIASLDEEKEINPLAEQIQIETKNWQEKGLTREEAQQRASYRIFTSKPGAYGAGLQGLIGSQNWQDDRDLARAYINWSSYTYGKQGIIAPAPQAFQKRLETLQIVLQNQDNREHDLLDSDDYYQFQGGLTAAIRSVTGKNPQVYFGDNSIVSAPKVRLLQEEINRVYRARVINPKWIAGVMRHGYKGAFEIAATVDLLFGYDATTKCVEDYMYEGVARAYLFEREVREFLEQKNPWALRDIAERLLEAVQRNLWKQPSLETIDALRSIAHQAEGIIENNIDY
jgi:cobaltochelatase CobN